MGLRISLWMVHEGGWVAIAPHDRPRTALSLGSLARVCNGSP